MALDIDRFSHVASSLQRWDPRAKIFSLGLFVLLTALLHTLPLAALALLFAVSLLLLSRIPLHFVNQGLRWVILFLLPFFFIVPTTYPGESAFHLLGLPFALEGLRLASLIVVKAMAIVIIAYVTFGSSRFDISMIAMQRLKCPTIIVQMLLFTYRYIFVFISEMRRLETAMKARGFVKRPNRYTIKVLGGFIGTLLIRSFERTERIYNAMLSKGYQGEFHSLVEFHMVNKDVLKAGLVVMLALAMIVADNGGWFAVAEQGWY